MWFFRFSTGRNRFYQTLGSLNLGAICVGLTMGWTNPSIESDIYGRNKNFGIKNSLELQAAMNFGTSVGAFVPMLIADIYGRRFSFLCSGITCATFWICTASAVNRTLLLFAAGVGGFGVGIYLTTTVLYVGEISSCENRGLVGAFTSFSTNFGFLIVGIVSLFVDLRTMAVYMVVMPVTFTFSIFLYMVESPYFLFQRGKVLDAKISLKNLRGRRTVLEVEEEYKSIESFFNSEHGKGTKAIGVLIQFFHPQSATKSVMLILPLLCLSQMIGGYAMNFYVEKLLKHVVPRYEYVILSSVNVVSVGFCLFAIVKVGRKPLLITSIAGSALCCFLLAIHKLVQRQDCQIFLKGELMIPVIIILAYFTIYFFGFIPILPILAGEIFPNRIKTVAAGICISFVYVAALIVQCVYEFLRIKTNSCLAFVSFAILGSIGLPLLISSLPETKGKSLYQIQNEMDNISVVMP